MLTFDEWKKKANGGEDPSPYRPQLEMLRQAAIKVDLLTGAPHWDTFLSYLQAAVDDTIAQRDAFRAVLSDSRTVDHDRLMAAKIALVECEGRIAAWEAVISLPKDIIEMGAQAKTLLERVPPVET